jgi:hypothetical protein
VAKQEREVGERMKERSVGDMRGGREGEDTSDGASQQMGMQDGTEAHGVYEGSRVPRYSGPTNYQYATVIGEELYGTTVPEHYPPSEYN